MRLAFKLFLANALIILVLVAVAAWTLGEVAKLIGSNRDIAVRATDALRVEASLREQVESAHSFEMRFLVFGDREYEKVPSQAAVRIQSGLDGLGALARSFKQMAERLREVDTVKEQFYATMAHELKSPMTSAREAAYLLEEGGPGPLNEKQQKLVSIIHRSTERLLRLVSQVLDLSRLSAGVLPLQRRPVPLERAARRAVKELRIQAEERGVKLGMEVRSAGLEAFADEDRVVQILVNLITNGIRFTPAGGAVTVRLLEAGDTVEIQVEDTGVGIPSAVLPSIFDRYRQAHTGFGGTGLGLAIVRGLTEAHAGRVTVVSEEGKGTRFTVTLPRPAAEAAPVDVPDQRA